MNSKARATWMVGLAFAVMGAAACKVNSEDVQYWKGTVKGPGKIMAVMLADKYPIELRTEAGLALVELERQDVDGLALLQEGLNKLRPEDREKIVAGMVPGLRKILDSGTVTKEGEEPKRSEVRAKDAAFLLIPMAPTPLRNELTKSVVSWYGKDFNGRSLAGNYSAEQVIRALGAPAAAALVDGLAARMPPQALVKLAQLIGQIGDPASKKAAAERLASIEQEMNGKAFVEWIKNQVREQAKQRDPKKPPNEKRVEEAALLNRDNFVVGGALAAMKHLADQPVIAKRLLTIASSNASEERRTAALQALEGKATREHLQKLLALALNPQNPVAVRDYAFDRVGDIRSEDALPKMWPLVQDSKDAKLRWRAGELVLGIGGAKVIGEFFSKLPGGDDAAYPPEELEGYASRLGQMSPLPTDIVRKELQSPHWWERVIALRFFERKGTVADVPQMQALANDSARVKGKGWDQDYTVGKVAASAIEGLRQRAGQPEGAAAGGS